MQAHFLYFLQTPANIQIVLSSQWQTCATFLNNFHEADTAFLLFLASHNLTLCLNKTEKPLKFSNVLGADRGRLLKIIIFKEMLCYPTVLYKEILIG